MLASRIHRFTSKVMWSTLFAVPLVALPISGFGQTVITVNAAANRHAISPLIYGVAFPTTTQLLDLNFTASRYGGNEASSYNWLQNAQAKGQDYYFETYPSDSSSVEGEAVDSFVSMSKAGNAAPMLTLPMLNYVGKLGVDRSSLWSYSISKYGQQTGADPYNGDAGDGISAASGNPFIDNDVNDANTANSLGMQQNWLSHLISKWGNSSGSGIKYYLMDNEPSIWHSSHRDVHPVGEKMDELYQDYLSYAGAIRAADPNALILGPEEWGWSGYFYSGYDQQYGSEHGWSNLPDRAAHNNMDHIPWLLQSLKSYQTSTGKRLLDYLSVHYYPQQGEFGNDDSSGMQTIRNRSTRSLWDPNYVDTSWIDDKVMLIPRLKGWVSNYYPGLKTAITEYNWGDEGALNGATAQADILGIFGREGLDLASRWTVPATNSPTYLAMKMYRNYAGGNSTFGDTSVSCSAPSPDSVSAFASQRTSDGALTVMVVNKVTSSGSVQVNFSGFSPAGAASAYQINSSSATSIQHLANVPVGATSFTATVPAQSVTLFVIPQLEAQYDFEDGAENWVASGSPIVSVADTTSADYHGKHALAINFSGSAGTPSVSVANPVTPAGATITMHLWIPAGSEVSEVRAFVKQIAAGGSVLTTGPWITSATLKTNAWNTITVVVPSNAAALAHLGLEFSTTAAWTGTCYLDAVGW